MNAYDFTAKFSLQCVLMRFGGLHYKYFPYVINTVWNFITSVCWRWKGWMSPGSSVCYFVFSDGSPTVCQRSMCRSIPNSASHASKNTQTLRNLAAQLPAQAGMSPLWQRSLSKSAFCWVCPPPALNVFSHSLYGMTHCLFAAFKILFVFWQVSIDGLGVESLNVACLGPVEPHTSLLNVFHQLWDIFCSYFLDTCSLSHSSPLGISLCVLGRNSLVSETTCFSV